MIRKELAISYFKQGYNCSQSVVLAFKDILKVDPEILVKVSSPFGGGLSRMRETCGAVSGMVLVIGTVFGYETPETGLKKKELYEKTQEVLREFESRFGSLTCRTLLDLKQIHDIPTPENRDEHFYKTRPCTELIGGAAEILENFLKKEKLINS